ncbi:DUF1707 domain-containing protein [Actinomycetospora sp. OC33-EN08]|uniref:DUF1707 domain-containing protein n=1 Tax=Actinomycetospora aurantiaca TaxID=3129233 RepID=A0ABU8MVX5_9PSEU
MGELRIGDRERELAMAALDEHRREGRLEASEYAERSAIASTARVRSEIDALFADLPAPHPVFPRARPDEEPGPGSGTSTAAPASPAREELPELVTPIGARLGRHAGLLSALAPVFAVVLLVVTGLRFPQVFLLVPVAIGLLAYLGHKHGG